MDSSPPTGWLRRVLASWARTSVVETPRADRDAAASMATRYRVLARVLDGGHDREVRLDRRQQVAILLIKDRREDGTAWRSLLRLDQTELGGAGWNGVSTPVVFDEFVLDHDRPVVRHHVGAVTITRGTDGRARIAGVPGPERDETDPAVTAMLDRTGADLALPTDLDDLIHQIRSGVVLTP